jgi:Leucine-rich repeat (LRR) protein
VFTELREISVSRNEIEVINSNLFEENPKLLKIDFSRNRIKHVGFNILKPLKGLLFADFYQNDCINEGSHNGVEILQRNLRRKCKPTVDMMLEDVKRLNTQIEMLTTELVACEKIHRNRRCDSESLVTLDTLFPSIFIGEENKIENF